MEVESGLVRLCIEAATENRATIEKWRRQRRTLEKMPTQLAEALLRRLLHRRLLFPSLLEVFKHSIEEIDLKGESSVNAEWMAYLGAFRYLRTLNLADCQRINNSALWAITGMDSLQELDLSRCKRVTDAGIGHLLSITNLKKLCISGTCLSAEGVTRLSSLINLTILDLGGLPVTDLALCSLQVLTKLERLDLWGSKISNKGASLLKLFTKLSSLNLAWTNVTKLLNLPSLECLNMSNCTINSVFEGADNRVKAPLQKLVFLGATFIDAHEVFFYIDASRLAFLDLSHSSLHNFEFLANMDALAHLDVSFSGMDDDSIALIAHVGANLKNLNLSNTRLTSAGVEILAGHVPNLETLSLSHTAIDDVALSYISLMPSLRVINLSNTAVRGFTYWVGDDPDQVPSLTALQNLNHLERLDLEDTQVGDGAMSPLSSLQELNYLFLKGGNISDVSLELMASIPKLKFLRICGGVLTNAGLHAFRPPVMLEMLDLSGCWLLTEDALSLFHKNHPHIEVKHELSAGLFADQVACDRPSSLQGSSQLKHKKGKMSKVPSQFLEEIDERLKYSREELLKLQFSPLSRASPHGKGTVIPKVLTN
ncbi:internalin I isoform X2 [Telopea speciosissima]|uniref:internalin I isoform X2 n=1 Tax=Telopea speciosissima TaxID=54955 RepID=UPI001CC48B43|nr:internalin I isoform X2 [Telopea speciosissima]